MKEKRKEGSGFDAEVELVTEMSFEEVAAITLCKHPRKKEREMKGEKKNRNLPLCIRKERTPGICCLLFACLLSRYLYQKRDLLRIASKMIV